MSTSNLRRSLSVTSMLLLLATLMVSCSPTRLYISTDQPEVKQVFVVAGSFGTLEAFFDKGSSRALGDFAQNLPNSSFDHTTLRLADQGDSVRAWKSVAAPRTDFLRCKIAASGDEVEITLKKGTFEKIADTALGVIVLTDSASQGQRYYGTLLGTPEIEPAGASFVASGPSIRVSLLGNDPPAYFKAN